jgi:hypothetical protein
LEETARKKIVGAPRGSKTVADETVAGGAPPAS